MSFFKNCYLQNYKLYDSLITHHDYQNKILSTIKQIISINDKIIADVGCGTGRLTSLLINEARKVYLCDASEKMLEGARERLKNIPSSKYEINVSNTFNLPYLNNSFDILIEGWSLSFCIREISLWDKLIDELLRVLRKNGTIILIETLGYGVESPNCTNSYLNSFYSYLINDRGFNFEWIRTDYQYTDENQAILYTNAFFDYDVTERLLINPQKTIPECTGIWWLTKR